MGEYVCVQARQVNITSRQWFDLLVQYAKVHLHTHPVQPSDVEGRPVPPSPWLSEDVHPDLGYWIARDYMFRSSHEPSQACDRSLTF